MNDQLQQAYTQLLTRELVPALGCTEPIAIALAAAKARELLGGIPEELTAFCSGNIIKNAKSVTVPMSEGRKGIEASALLGMIGGDPALGLEVLSRVCPAHLTQLEQMLDQGLCQVRPLETDAILDILIRARRGTHTASARIRGDHTRFVYLEKDGQVILETVLEESPMVDLYQTLRLEDIWDYCREVPAAELEGTVGRQLEYNGAISREGFSGRYGACVGNAALALSDDLRTRACAAAAAASDARMSGCTAPVIILSGSGNQGITASLPVAVYAREWGKSREELLRAVAFSDLVCLLQKREVGKLSAYCGAVCAACGAGAGVAYLHGDGLETVRDGIVNTLGNISGMVCDGAKPSCAAKIASAVNAALLGYQMASMGKVFSPGDGIVKGTAEETIVSVGCMAKKGMAETDRVILHIMLGA